MKIVQERILLQYGKEGEKGEYQPVTKDQAEKFVALDDAAGGYPSPVEIDRAHDFKTFEAAVQYNNHFKSFNYRQVTVTYEF